MGQEIHEYMQEKVFRKDWHRECELGCIGWRAIYWSPYMRSYRTSHFGKRVGQVWLFIDASRVLERQGGHSKLVGRDLQQNPPSN